MHKESPENPTEQLSRWIETGYTYDAVAVQSTTLQDLQQILTSGNLTPTSGKNIHYAYALVENFQQNFPELAFDLIEGSQPYCEDHARSELIQENVRQTIAGQIPESISETSAIIIHPDLYSETIREDTRFSAQMKSLIDIFNSKTGLQEKNVDNIIAASIVLWPAEFTFYKMRCPFPGLRGEHDFQDNFEPDTLRDILRFLRRHRDITPDWLNSPGVLLYLNNNFLQSGQSSTSSEEDTALIVESTQPIPSSVISGIEISPQDLAILKKSL